MQVRLTVDPKDMATVVAAAKCFAEMISGEPQLQIKGAMERLRAETAHAVRRTRGGK